MDPRRRCKYTCKVTEVSSPLPGEEQNLKWEDEENHTIVHSPNHHRGEQDLNGCEKSAEAEAVDKKLKIWVIFFFTVLKTFFLFSFFFLSSRY